MESEAGNVGVVCLIVVSSLCYCYFVSGALPPGKRRLLSLLPVLCIFALIPLCTSSVFFTGVSAFFFTWMSNFKLLLFAFDRGPISAAPGSFPIFVATAALPFKVRAKNQPPRKPKRLPLNLTAEIPISAVILSAVCAYKERIHPNALLILYSCLIFLLVEVLVGVSSAFLGAVFGLDLEPPSDEPYLATTVREFWGRRWNLAVNEILREAVYRPMLSAAKGKEWGALAAAMAVFVVSGVMHEVMLWHVTRATPSGEMSMFFVVQGGFVAVESWANRKKKKKAPWFVGWPVTMGIVIGTAFWLFFPPLIKNDADVRLLGELEAAAQRCKQMGHVLGLNF